MPRPAADRKFTPQRNKLVDVILYVIEQFAARSGQSITQYQIVKSIFLADVAHLEDYGRPVVFDNYFAMEHGPVPSEAYDMLKPKYDWKKVGMEAAPWATSVVSVSGSGEVRHYRLSKRQPDLRNLSKSDALALSKAIDQVQRLTFGQIRDETHRHKAYIEAWNDGKNGKNPPMDMSLLMPHEDVALLETLVEASRHSLHVQHG